MWARDDLPGGRNSSKQSCVVAGCLWAGDGVAGLSGQCGCHIQAKTGPSDETNLNHSGAL